MLAQEASHSPALVVGHIRVGEPEVGSGRERGPSRRAVDMAKEEPSEDASERATARGADHPRERDVQCWLAAARVRPVDHDRAPGGEEDVVGVEVEVKELLALEGDLVEAAMQVRERPCVARHAPRSATKVSEHCRPFDTLEHERIVEHVEHFWHWKAVRTRVSHDLSLAGGPAPSFEAPEHSAAPEVDDLRGAPLCDHTHGGP
jgi:hypothetical protein